jgi:N utilization substance protein B
MTRRTRARAVALQLLYQDEFNAADETRWTEFVRGRLGNDRETCNFALGLARGVRTRRVEIDGLLKQWSQRWEIARMPAIDRSILRLGAFEVVWLGTPKPVAINEAIELAKRYGSQQSYQFVNGILDRLTPAAASSGSTPPADAPSESAGA